MRLHPRCGLKPAGGGWGARRRTGRGRGSGTAAARAARSSLGGTARRTACGGCAPAAAPACPPTCVASPPPPPPLCQGRREGRRRKSTEMGGPGKNAGSEERVDHRSGTPLQKNRRPHGIAKQPQNYCITPQTKIGFTFRVGC